MPDQAQDQDQSKIDFDTNLTPQTKEETAFQNWVSGLGHDRYSPIDDPIAAQVEKNISPYQRWSEKNPQFSNVPKEHVLEQMHKHLAPDLEPERFNALATSAGGWDAIKKARENLTPVEKFRKAYPQFIDVPRDRIIARMYQHAVDRKEVDPSVMSEDEFRHNVDPLPDGQNELWNAWEGIKTMSSATLHGFNAGVTGGWEKGMRDMFFEWLDKMGTHIDINIDNGKITTKVTPSTAGTELKKMGEQGEKDLHEKVDKWIATTMPSFWEVVRKVREMMSHGDALTMEAQDRAKQRDLVRSQNAQGVSGEAGKIIGEVGTDLILKFPIGGALQKGFQATKALEAFDEAAQAQSMMNKAAAFGATGLLTGSKYREAIEAHHKNAFGEALLTGFSAGMQSFLFNMPIGRVQMGVTNALLDAVPSTMQLAIDGHPSSITDFATQGILDFGLAAIVKGHGDIPLRQEHIPPAEFESHHPVSAGDLLGPEGLGYSEKMPSGKPIRVVPTTTTTTEFNVPSAIWTPPTEAAEDVLAKGRPLTRQQPVAGERGIRLITNQLRANVPSLDEVVHDPYALKEAELETPPISVTTKYGKKAQAALPSPGRQRVSYSPAVMEEIGKANEAREANDTVKALGHMDKATALMSDEERTQFKNDVIDEVNATPSKDTADPGKTYNRAAMDQKYGVVRRPLANRGEAGAIINPAQLLISGARKARVLYDEYWKYAPFLPKGQRYKEAAALYRKGDIEYQSDELIKDHMAVHAALNPWGYQAQLRRNTWNIFNNDILKQFLINRDEGRRSISPVPKHQGNVDYYFDLYDDILAGARATRQHFSFDPKQWYVRQMVVKWMLKKFDEKMQDWHHAHPNLPPDAIPPLRTVIGWNLLWKSWNPEDWLQAELNQTRQPLNKVNMFHLYENAGKAVLVTPTSIQPNGKWQAHESPNGEKFYVEPETWAVMERYFDDRSLYDIPVLAQAFGLARYMKSFSANMLSWSLFHYRHIWSINMAHALSEWQSGADPDVAFGNLSAYRLQMPGKGHINPVRLSNDPVIDYFHELIPKWQMTPEQLREIDFLKRAGMNMGINSERQMQLQFARSIANFARKFHTVAHGTDRAVTTFLHLAQFEWLQHQMFGEWIPRIKIQAFRTSVNRLLNNDPTLEYPQNYKKFSMELAKIGDDIDNRFGERNMANLLWPKVVKELGTSTLLSLGWTSGFVKLHGDTLYDLFDSTVHVRDVLRIANDPKKRPFMTSRMKFYANYTLSYIMQGALMSMLYGWSHGKKFERKDLTEPVIGEDKSFPLNDPRHWTRGRPGEFQAEVFTLINHIQQHGGFTPLGLAYGGADFFSNKFSPGVRSLYDAIVLQKDFFGKDIGGNILDDDWKRITDKTGYILYNDLTPITARQEIEPRVGHPAPRTFWEYAHNIASPDALPLIIGFPRAPQYVYRSGFENYVENAFTRKENKIKTEQIVQRSNWLNEYRQALENNDDDRAERALDVLDKDFKIPQQSITRINHEVGQLQELEEEYGVHIDGGVLYMFQHGGFTAAEQKKMLEKATPKEREIYEQFIKPEEEPGE